MVVPIFTSPLLGKQDVNLAVSSPEYRRDLKGSETET
jgi:hypothetical protein